MPDQGLYPHPHGEQSSLDERVEPLDVPQQFTPASSYQVRGELEAYVRRDLLGPWGAEDEEFSPRARGPRERYLVAMLGPKLCRRRRPGPRRLRVVRIAMLNTQEQPAGVPAGRRLAGRRPRRC